MSKKKEERVIECLPAEYENNIRLFPDGFGIGASDTGDIVSLDFYITYGSKPFILKRFAFTPRRARDLLRALEKALEECDRREQKEKKGIEETSKTEKVKE
jgi:hypothetical protein